MWFLVHHKEISWFKKRVFFESLCIGTSKKPLLQYDINSYHFFSENTQPSEKPFIFLNLHKIDHNPVWGDGTPMESTEAYMSTKIIIENTKQHVFIIDSNMNINDYFKHHSSFYFCQKDTFGFLQ